MNNVIYNACKRTILRKDYPQNMSMRLKVFYENNLITEEQYNELIKLMEVE